jgi:RNA polymerase sigma factor (sigma-70 family)
MATSRIHRLGESGRSATVGSAPLPSGSMAAIDPRDPDLLRAYLAGDQGAFERLYGLYDRPCFDFIRRMLGVADDGTAEDLHQEVWLSVARSASSYDAGKSRFVTWLFTIARNKVTDHFRRASGVVHLVAQACDESPDDFADVPQISPEHIAQNRQLAAAIVREVQALPYAQRETFVLFAHNELSLEEVAQITHVGIETAKSRLRYARTTLRHRLADWEVHHA